MATKQHQNPDAGPDYYGIFNAFAQAMRKDFVGLPAGMKSIGYQRYIEEFGQKVWKGEGYTIQFVGCLSDYLLTFRTRGVRLSVDHSKTPYYPDYTWGMRVRAFKDRLYVTEALPECPFKPGDAIANACIYAEPTFRSIPALRRRFGQSLYGDTEDREIWDPLLHFANRYLIEADTDGSPTAVDCHGDGSPDIPAPLLAGLRLANPTTTRRIKVERLPVPAPLPPFELDTLDGGTLLLTLRNLSDEPSFASFVGRNKSLLDGANKIVVDARRCSGGTETALLPLLPYVVAQPVSLASGYMEPTCLTNYSAGNVKRQTVLFDRLAKQSPTDSSLQEAIVTWKNTLAEMSGAGIVEEQAFIPNACRDEVAPRGRAARVCLLTDIDTCDAADLLAEVCRDSSRAVTVGRATRGSRGYFNPISLSMDCFALHYPTSRYTDEGLARHFSLIGVPPEVYVPWTPESIEHDADLAMSLQLLA